MGRSFHPGSGWAKVGCPVGRTELSSWPLTLPVVQRARQKPLEATENHPAKRIGQSLCRHRSSGQTRSLPLSTVGDETDRSGQVLLIQQILIEPYHVLDTVLARDRAVKEAKSPGTHIGG